MKLYYAPGVCSIGIHVLLEEIGKPYDAIAVNLREGAQYKPDYTAVNPKSKVPTLVDDEGTIRTEYPAIAYWLAKALELMDYCVATIHMQGFTRIFRPANFAPNATDEAAVKARGTEIAEKGFAALDHGLVGKDYAVGPFSIADSALFYVEFWSRRVGIALPANCAAHLERMLARPAVQRTMKAEGLA
jgi:glutathione S-transferase